MNFNNYVNEKMFPLKSDYTKYIGYKNGQIVFSTEFGQEPTAEERDLSAVVEKFVNDILYDLKRNEYTQEGNRLYNLFKRDLFAEYGVQGNPKKELAFNMAWERGHSEGYEQVESYFSELVPLII